MTSCMLPGVLYNFICAATFNGIGVPVCKREFPLVTRAPFVLGKIALDPLRIPVTDVPDEVVAMVRRLS
jgi:hypothetical protein